MTQKNIDWRLWTIESRQSTSIGTGPHSWMSYEYLSCTRGEDEELTFFLWPNGKTLFNGCSSTPFQSLKLYLQTFSMKTFHNKKKLLNDLCLQQHRLAELSSVQKTFLFSLFRHRFVLSQWGRWGWQKNKKNFRSIT